MSLAFLALLINAVANVFVWVVVISSLLSFFMPPYHPLREALDRIVTPFLEPIRRVLPPLGGFDFSPLVLVLVVSAVAQLLIRFLLSIR